MIKHIAYRDDYEEAPEALLEGKMLSYVALLTDNHADRQNGTDWRYYPLPSEIYDRLFPNNLRTWIQ